MAFCCCYNSHWQDYSASSYKIQCCTRDSELVMNLWYRIGAAAAFWCGVHKYKSENAAISLPMRRMRKLVAIFTGARAHARWIPAVDGARIFFFSYSFRSLGIHFHIYMREYGGVSGGLAQAYFFCLVRIGGILCECMWDFAHSTIRHIYVCM